MTTDARALRSVPLVKPGRVWPAASVALVGHALAVVPLTVLAIPFVYPFVSSAWRGRETSLSTPPGQLESVS